jgi:molybdenum cofactor guanylyltransferase
MSNNPISCIILAGGEAKRFNRKDKGLVELNKKPLIAHVIDRVKNQVDDIVISANRNIETYKRYTPNVIADQLENFQGPLAGIAAAMPYCKHKRVLIVPCDIPLLPHDLVEKLVTDNTNHLHIVKSGERLQLIFLMPHNLLHTLNSYLEQGHQKVMDWAKSQNPIIIEFDDVTNAFANLNTLDDLKQLSD